MEHVLPKSAFVPKPLEGVWILCPYPVTALGLVRILESKVRVHVGREFEGHSPPSCVVLCVDSTEELSEAIKRVRASYPEAPVVVFGMQLDLPLAWAALKMGARGFIHAEMEPDQVIRALKVVTTKGEIIAPRKLIEYLIAKEWPTADLDLLSSRQREILVLVSEGLSNAQIAERLFLSESTIKQHLRGAYKVLNVHNRTEAAGLIRNSE